MGSTGEVLLKKEWAHHRGPEKVGFGQTDAVHYLFQPCTSMQRYESACPPLAPPCLSSVLYIVVISDFWLVSRKCPRCNNATVEIIGAAWELSFLYYSSMLTSSSEPSARWVRNRRLLRNRSRKASPQIPHPAQSHTRRKGKLKRAAPCFCLC